MPKAGRWRALLLFVATTVSAQESAPPQTTVVGNYTFTAQGGENQAPWTSVQSAEAGVTGRWGASFRLDARLTAPFDGSNLKADDVVKQLALTWNPTAWSVVTLGKQRLKWGSARILSAIDGLEPVFDPLHPSAPLDGVAGLKAELLPTDWLGLSVLALPASQLEDTKLAARADVLWEDTDLSAGAVSQRERALVQWNGSSATTEPRSQVALFADVAKFFDQFGVYAEVQVKRYRARDWYGLVGGQPVSLTSSEPTWSPRTTVGVQVDWPVWLHGTVTWITEYRYDAAGFDANEAAQFSAAWAQQASSTFQAPSGLTVGTFSKHYAITSVSGLPLTPSLTMGASLLAGLDTGFGLGRMTADYKVDQHLSLEVAYSRFDHAVGTAASAGDLAFLRLRDQITLSVSAAY